MEIINNSVTRITLRDEEIEALKSILQLAHSHLQSFPCIQIKGSPLERQAGLVGPDLIHVKRMLEKFGNRLGIELPMDAKPNNEVTDVLVIYGLTFPF